MSFHSVYSSESESFEKILLSRREHRLIELANRLALNSDYELFKHGAVLVKGGVVLNTGYNRSRFTSFGARFRHPTKGKATVHAELSVLLNVDKTLTEGATIYVTRRNKCGALRNSRPCLMCSTCASWMHVRACVFSLNESNETGLFGYVRF